MTPYLRSALTKAAPAVLLALAFGATEGLQVRSDAGQEAAAQAEAATLLPKANPEDVESFDAILKALYDVISGEMVGADGANARDWDRFASLFHPELGRLIPLQADVRSNPDAPAWKATGVTPAGYAERARGWMRTTAFYEKEIHRVEERFGGIAHAWSTYEGFNAKDAEAPFLRGVNSIQAMYDGSRWWLLVVAWDAERPDQKLPDKYLPKK